jgi:hypothetical protein
MKLIAIAFHHMAMENLHLDRPDEAEHWQHRAVQVIETSNNPDLNYLSPLFTRKYSKSMSFKSERNQNIFAKQSRKSPATTAKAKVNRKQKIQEQVVYQNPSRVAYEYDNLPVLDRTPSARTSEYSRRSISIGNADDH